MQYPNLSYFLWCGLFMSAALKSYVPRPVPSSAAPAPQSRAAASPAKASVGVLRPLKAGAVKSLPVATTPSPLRRTLAQVHLVSSVLAASLVSLTLVGYGTSVYVDRQLNQATNRLSDLQRSEQQLTTANATLTRHMAQQAEDPATGLQPPKPNQVIFLQPAPQRPAQVVEEPAAAPTQATRPLGY